MIIEICDSTKNDLSDNESIIDALERVAQSRKSGNCIVLSKKETINKILSLKELSRKYKTTFTKIKNDQTQWSHFLRKFTPAIRIVQKGTENKSPSSPFEICLEDFLNDEGNIIAENINDINFLRKITENSYRCMGLNGVNVKFRGLNGGGSTTHQVIDDFQKNRIGESAFCLLDSDKSFFCDESYLGNTASRAMEKINKNIVKPYILKCREIENIIPFNVIESLFSGNQDLKKKLESIKKLSSVTINEKPALKFFDMKNGIKEFELKDKISTINGNIEEFEKIGNCSCKSKKKCQCKIIDGVGSDLLPKVIEHMSDSEFSFYEYENYKKTEIRDIVKMATPFVLTFSRSATY